MENYKIYALKLKDEEIIRYVGLTKQSLHNRLRGHKNITSKCKTKNGYWVNKNKNNIEIILIEESIENLQDANEREIYWINYYKELGNDLTNGTLGGDGVNPTEESRKKMSESQMGKILSDEHIEKIKKSNTGKKRSKEICKKFSELRKGIIFSDEHCKNISKSNKGRISPNKDKPMSDDTKNKISDTLSGKPTSRSREVDVFLYETNEYVGRFGSIIESTLFLKIDRNNVSNVLSGRLKHWKGYIFKYVDI